MLPNLGFAPNRLGSNQSTEILYEHWLQKEMQPRVMRFRESRYRPMPRSEAMAAEQVRINFRDADIRSVIECC